MERMNDFFIESQVGIRFNNPYAGIHYHVYVDEPVQETWAQKRRWELLKTWVENRRKALKWRVRAVKWPLVFIAFIIGVALATFIGWLLHAAVISMMLGVATHLACSFLAMEIDDRFPYEWSINYRQHKSFERVKRINKKRK